VATSTNSETQKRTDISLPFEPLLDSTEAAALLKIHPKTLQRMARNGEITGIAVAISSIGPEFLADTKVTWMSFVCRKFNGQASTPVDSCCTLALAIRVAS